MNLRLRPSVIRVINDLGQSEGLLASLPKILGVPKSLLYAVGTDNIAHLLSQMGDINLDSSPIPILDTFFWKKRSLKSCGNNFCDGTAIQFAVSWYAYQQYTKTANRKYLVEIFQALYRDTPLVEKSASSEFDFYEDIPVYILLVSLRYFEAIQKLVFNVGENHKLWANGQRKSKIEFTWHLAFRSMVEYDLQKYDDLSQRPFWDVFQVMLEKNNALQSLKNDTTRSD